MMKTTITILMLFVCITLVGQTQVRKFSVEPDPVPAHITDSSDIANEYYSEYRQSWILGDYIRNEFGKVISRIPVDTARIEKCVVSAYLYRPKTPEYLETVYSFFYHINKIDSAYKYLMIYASTINRRILKTGDNSNELAQQILNAHYEFHNK